ncbi:hypothetical protein CW304_03405 [Bacillus sp. UFRGS-B20]|nr:hypothetical protein CW304_03405 [Bacillus sp. UFRGS-B20]
MGSRSESRLPLNKSYIGAEPMVRGRGLQNLYSTGFKSGLPPFSFVPMLGGMALTRTDFPKSCSFGEVSFDPRTNRVFMNGVKKARILIVVRAFLFFLN